MNSRFGSLRRNKVESSVAKLRPKNKQAFEVSAKKVSQLLKEQLHLNQEHDGVLGANYRLTIMPLVLYNIASQ